MPPPLVIFDFDGTIADSAASIALTAQVALAELGEPPIDDEAFVSRIGLPLAQVFDEILPDLTPDRRAQLVAIYRQRFAEVSREHTTVFDGMLELLADLRAQGSRLAIATGKSTSGAHKSIARLDLDPTWFSVVVGTDAVPRPKPHPDMVLHVLAETGVAADHATVVGDTTFDIRMGTDAGVSTIGVTWGSHAPTALRDAGARVVVSTRQELRTHLFG